MSGDTLYDGWNVDQQEDFGFSSSFSEKKSRIIDGITKRKPKKIKSTKLLNIYEQQFNNPIVDDIYEHEYDK